jgi:pSer/pThr/pTyr-binding forkhead associated (FHA) protein
MALIGEAILMVRGGPDEGASVPLSGGMTMMGRAALNDVVLEEPGVSRQHAGIRGDAEGYWIADLGSRNGTYVNSERLGADPRRLRNFDRIDLGGTDTTVHWIFMESQSTIDVAMPPQE